jgi:hypothetical protein
MTEIRWAEVGGLSAVGALAAALAALLHDSSTWERWLIRGLILIAFVALVLAVAIVVRFFRWSGYSRSRHPPSAPSEVATGQEQAKGSLASPPSQETNSRKSFKSEDTANASVLRSSMQEKEKSGAKASLAIFSAIAIPLSLIIWALVSMSTPQNSGNPLFSTNVATVAMPQTCAGGGAVIFAVSGRENSPAPALTPRMTNAAINAIKEGSAIGIVDLDGRPRLVAAGAFGNPAPNREVAEEEEINYLQTIARTVSSVRAAAAHADVLDALATSGYAIRASCDHGGTIYVLDSGLQETGTPNFSKPGVLDDSPSKIVALLASQDDLPPLQGINIVFTGLGDTAAPQGQLSSGQHKQLIAVWSAIAKASGVASVTIDYTPRSGAAPTHVPPVQLVGQPSTGS